MTSSHYNNIIQGTLGDIGLEHLDDSAYVAKKIFDNCGVAFPTGNSEAVLAVLQSNDYVGWRSCTAGEAQENANEGVAAVAISNDCVTVIRPEERAVLVKSTFINPMANYSFARTADEVSDDDEARVEYFAYSAARVTTLPTVYASVSQVNSSLSSNQRNVNARYIYSYLRNWGFTKEAACGVLGNMEVESDCDPGVWERMSNVDNGYGLVQWTPASHFLTWAVEEGVLGAANAAWANSMAKINPALLMNTQLACLVRDGDGGACKRFFKPAKANNYSGQEMTYAEYKKSMLKVEILAAVFCDHFERPQINKNNNLPEGFSDRKSYARKWFDLL